MATYNELATNYANQKKQEYEQSLGYLTEGLNKQQALDKTALQQRYDNLINQIKVIPEFFFYREMLTFYEELITYHFDKKQEHIRKCKLILESCEWGGMQVYGEEMKKFFDEYKDQ